MKSLTAISLERLKSLRKFHQKLRHVFCPCENFRQNFALRDFAHKDRGESPAQNNVQPENRNLFNRIHAQTEGEPNWRHPAIALFSPDSRDLMHSSPCRDQRTKRKECSPTSRASEEGEEEEVEVARAASENKSDNLDVSPGVLTFLGNAENTIGPSMITQLIPRELSGVTEVKLITPMKFSENILM